MFSEPELHKTSSFASRLDALHSRWDVFAVRLVAVLTTATGAINALSATLPVLQEFADFLIEVRKRMWF